MYFLIEVLAAEGKIIETRFQEYSTIEPNFRFRCRWLHVKD